MGKTLLIFLFSDRVDPYVNAIAYTFDNMQVDTVRLVQIKGTKTGLTETQASAVYNRIWTLIENLSKGYYIDSAAGQAEQRLLSRTDKLDIYRRINERLTEHSLVRLDYTNLKEDLNQLIRREGGSKCCIVDLTAASKSPSIDVFSVCLALGVGAVYTFELADRPNPKNPELSLYHALGKDGYSYTCIGETEPVRASQAALLRKSSLLWYVGAIALVVMVVSLYLLATTGPNSLIVQGLNLAAAVVGIVSFILAIAEQRRHA